MTFEPEPEPSTLGQIPKQGIRFKTKLIIIAAILLFIIGIMAYEVIHAHKFKWQSPVQFQSPVRIESAMLLQLVRAGYTDNAVETERLRPVLYPKSNRINDIVRKVYQLESTSGQHDSCRAKGLFNGYGYNPGTCYKSHEEITAIVTSWFETKLTKYPLANTLCGYNLGFNSSHLTECVNQSVKYHYYKDYLNL